MRKQLNDYIAAGNKIHLVGIGGVSMSPLAEVLFGKGVHVTGSDFQESAAVAHLRKLGIPVVIGHKAQSVQGAHCVIRTAAVHDDNPEIAAARAADIPIFERAQAWGVVMGQYQNALCVAGTHGKTTTTAMCAQIFLAAQRDPSVMLGGTLSAMGSGHRIGQGDTIIMESCEYCDSFLSFSPTVAVILNIAPDHLDYFSGIEQIKASFAAFANLVPHGGFVVANYDDENTRAALAHCARNIVSFGVAQGEVHAANLTWESGCAHFDLIYKDVPLTQIALKVAGEHNLQNALGACAAALCLNVPAHDIAHGLGEFTGAARRLEYKGSYGGATLYDDYAHHPDELNALFAAVKKLGFQRVICAFQPHTYTRTHELFDEFVQALKAADIVLLAEIYAAREQNTVGISSKDLTKEIPNATYCPTLEDVTAQFARLAQAGDLLLTVGAGDIVTAGEKLLRLEQ